MNHTFEVLIAAICTMFQRPSWVHRVPTPVQNGFNFLWIKKMTVSWAVHWLRIGLVNVQRWHAQSVQLSAVIHVKVGFFFRFVCLFFFCIYCLQHFKHVRMWQIVQLITDDAPTIVPFLNLCRSVVCNIVFVDTNTTDEAAQFAYTLALCFKKGIVVSV